MAKQRHPDSIVLGKIEPYSGPADRMIYFDRPTGEIVSSPMNRKPKRSLAEIRELNATARKHNASVKEAREAAAKRRSAALDKLRREPSQAALDEFKAAEKAYAEAMKLSKMLVRKEE